MAIKKIRLVCSYRNLANIWMGFFLKFTAVWFDELIINVLINKKRYCPYKRKRYIRGNKGTVLYVRSLVKNDLPNTTKLYYLWGKYMFFIW